MTQSLQQHRRQGIKWKHARKEEPTTQLTGQRNDATDVRKQRKHDGESRHWPEGTEQQPENERLERSRTSQEAEARKKGPAHERSAVAADKEEKDDDTTGLLLLIRKGSMHIAARKLA